MFTSIDASFDCLSKRMLACKSIENDCIKIKQWNRLCLDMNLNVAIDSRLTNKNILAQNSHNTACVLWLIHDGILMHNFDQIQSHMEFY